MGRWLLLVGSGEIPAAGIGMAYWPMICCGLFLSSLTRVLLRGCIDDLGLLLVLPGLVMRIGVPDRVELRDGLLTTCEAASCLDHSSNAASEDPYCGKAARCGGHVMVADIILGER